MFDRDGSDAMRWFLMASPILRGGNLVVTEQGIREGVRQAILPLWNTWYFLSLYAGAAGTHRQVPHRLAARARPVRPGHARPRWSTTSPRRWTSTTSPARASAVRDHAEALTNWYVRRSRDRFWAGDADAIDTLHTVLEVTARVAAPLLPLTMEQLWQGLTGGRSVHLADWPAADLLPHDDALVAAMERVRQVASAALSLRKARGLRVRLPLAALTVAAADAARAARRSPTSSRDEVNVKEVVLTDDVAAHGRFEVAVNARACGPRLGGDTQKVIRAVKAGEWSADADGTVTAARDRAAARRVHRAAGRGRRRAHRRAARQHRPGAAGHGGDAGAGRRGHGPRRRAAWCSRRAGTRGSTSPTGSRSPWTPRTPCVDAVRAHEAFVAGRGAGHVGRPTARCEQPTSTGRGRRSPTAVDPGRGAGSPRRSRIHRRRVNVAASRAPAALGGCCRLAP